MEDDFYATIKLVSGEEIFCKVSACDEEDRILLIISNPIVISHLKSSSKLIGYKIEPWLKSSSDDMLILNMNHVMTMSESFDLEIITLYQSYLRQSHKEFNHQSKITRSMGYLSNVNDAKEFLENIFKNH